MSDIRFTAIPVAGSAIQILGANTGRKGAIIKNNSSVAIYIHTGSGVTASNGFPLAQNATLEIGAYEGAIYAIGASAGGDLRIIEEVGS